MTKTMKTLVAVVITVMVIGMAWVGYLNYQETQLKMAAMRYMNANWYTGIEDDCNIISVKDQGDGRYDVQYSWTSNGEKYYTHAEMPL